jgi:hypothetical protein
MPRHGIPVTYVTYRDEGHGLSRAENHRSSKAVAKAFPLVHLGGRCEPVRDDFSGSSIEFKCARLSTCWSTDLANNTRRLRALRREAYRTAAPSPLRASVMPYVLFI